MFLTIFKYEMRYWLRRPIFYIYAAIFFIFPILISSSSAGLFDSITTTTGSTRIANSAIEIFDMFNAMLVIMLILFPSIIGVAINRDYKSEMHTIMYSYPFTKTNYLFAKFLSENHHPIEIAFYRNTLVFIGFCAYLTFSKKWSLVRTNRRSAHIKRGFVGTLGLVCGFWSISFLQSASIKSILY